MPNRWYFSPKQYCISLFTTLHYSSWHTTVLGRFCVLFGTVGSPLNRRISFIYIWSALHGDVLFTFWRWWPRRVLIDRAQCRSTVMFFFLIPSNVFSISFRMLAFLPFPCAVSVILLKSISYFKYSILGKKIFPWFKEECGGT